MAELHSLPSAADITRQLLPNGILVLARPNFNSPSISMSGYLQTGALNDPPDKLGLSDFTSLALMRGTQTRNFQEIFDALESAGASFGYNGGTHTTGFGGKALAEDLPLLMEILSDTLRAPAFPAEHVERLRAQLLTHLAIQSQDTGDMASQLFDRIVYAGHPYALPEEGTPETIQSIQPADLAWFHEQNYGPQGMVITVVGAVEPQKVVELVAYYLGDWENPQQTPPVQLPPVPVLSQTVREHYVIAGKSQADLILGAPGPKRNDPEFFTAAVGNSILGQFGMYGRIGEVVREQNGLAYYAYSSLSGGIGPGPWYLAAGTDPKNVARVIDLIRGEVRRFTTEPVSQQELEDNQANFIGRLPLSLESNTGVAAAIINLERYDLDLDYYLKYPDMVRAVTPQQILETSRRFLDPARLAIASAGPRLPVERKPQTKSGQ
jgi:zinc protease